MPGFSQTAKKRVTIIPKAGISVKKEHYLIDSYVTGWTEPSHTLKSHVAQEPLEDGVLVSDHVIALPAELELKGMVSDVKDGASAPGRAWDKVRELHQERAILNIVTEWGYYSDMVIKHAETKQTGRGMQFTLTCQQILRVGVFFGQLENPANLRTEEMTVPVVLDVAGDGSFSVNIVTGELEVDPRDIDPETRELNYDVLGQGKEGDQ